MCGYDLTNLVLPRGLFYIKVMKMLIKFGWYSIYKTDDELIAISY